ncbi:MAG: protein kinase [Anaerolineales bacterium]
MPLKPGESLHDRYHIESVLGQGGMGAVYKARDKNLNVEVAVKENLFTTKEYARQFEREARILASLRHPNLPRVTDHFVIPDQGQYLVMDFIEGKDLRERIESKGVISEGEAVPWFLETCDALAYLHNRRPHPILHRDIKPGNIKVTPDNRAILVDFGLAKVADDSGTTTTGAKAMTPGFSPPEQYGTGSTDARTDVYALGATIYACLTAEIPEDSLERAMGREELTPLRKRNPRITPALARAIEKSLSIRPEERYQSMVEFASALGAAARASGSTLVRDFPYLERDTRTPITAGFADMPTRLPLEEKDESRWPRIVLPLLAASLIVVGVVYALPNLIAGIGGLSGEDVSPTPTLILTNEPTDVAVLLPVATPTLVLPSATPLPTADPALTLTPLPTPIGGGIGQIAFASDREGPPQIHIVNVDGTGEVALTNLPDGACQPFWAPDGQALVFTSPCAGSQETYPGAGLWILNMENLQPQPLQTTPGGDYDGSWSPDGERIAFASERGGRPQIYSTNLDGSEVVNLSDNFARELQPVWSPQGTALTFVSYRRGNAQLWTMSDGGENDQRFGFGDTDDTHPAWSHDGQLVIFQRNVSGVPRLVASQFEDRGILDFRVCQQAPYSGQPMAEPSFSPDDRWLAVETWPDGVNHDIAIMTTNCTSVTLLTLDPAEDFDPAWRP